MVDEATSADAPSTPRNRVETRRRCAETWWRQEHSATPFLQNPLSNVHGDYTARSGLTRARQSFGDRGVVFFDIQILRVSALVFDVVYLVGIYWDG